MTLDTILAEQGRELLFEARRRTDLIRFRLFTGANYLWVWKGTSRAGRRRMRISILYGLPLNELSANPNLNGIRAPERGNDYHEPLAVRF